MKYTLTDTAISRRHFFISVLGARFLRPRFIEARLQTKRQDSQLPIRVSTLNHVSFGCEDLRRTVQWYGRVLGMPVHAFQDYSGGQSVLRIGNGPAYIALSQQSQGANGQLSRSLPHFCWGVEDFNVDRILRALSEMQAPAQAVLREGKTINGVNFTDPDGFPLQFNPVAACGGGGFLGDQCDTTARVVPQPGAPQPVAVRTLNHVRLIVPNVQRTLAWYQRLTDMKLQASPRETGELPTRILRVGSGPHFVALAEGSGAAAYRPHVGFGVEDFDPDRTMERLAQHGVAARKSMRGRTPEVVIDAPDNVEIQLQDISYCAGDGLLGNSCY